MKKLLCFVLALAMIFGCLSMVTVAHAEGTEYAGVKIEFSELLLGGAGNYFYVYNVANTATDNGDGTSTLKVRFYVEGDNPIWIEGITVIDNGDSSEITKYNAGWAPATNGEWKEFNIVIPTSSVHDNLCYKFGFSAASLINLIFDAPGSNATGAVTNRMWFQNCAGTLSAVAKEQMPGYVPEYAGVELDMTTTFGNGIQNNVVLYSVKDGVEINGDTASITVKFYNPEYNEPVWFIFQPFDRKAWSAIPSSLSSLYTSNMFATVNPGESAELTATFDASYVNDSLAISLYFTMNNAAPAGTSFVVSSNANIYLSADKETNGIFFNPCQGNARNLTAEQMPDYVAPTVEPTEAPTPEPTEAPTPVPVIEHEGARFTLTSVAFEGETPVNYVWFYNTSKSATVVGDTATISVRIFNEHPTARMWVNLNACILAPWEATASGEHVFAPAAEWLELSVSFDKRYLESDQFAFFISFTTADFVENASFVIDADINENLTLQGCAGSVEYLGVEDFPVEVVPVGVKLDIISPEKEEIFHINNSTTISDAMVTDGVVTYTTSIYNPNNHDITIQVQLLKGWGLLATNTFVEVVVPANYKKTVALTVNLADEGITKEDVRVRYATMAGAVEGDILYFTAVNAGEGFYDVANWWQNEGKEDTKSIATELPALNEAIVNKIEGAQLQLGSSLSVIYYATVDNNFINSGNDIILAVTRNDKTVYITGAKVDKNMYSFTYTGINAQCMADTIDAVLLCGEDMLDSYADYSVKQYAINQYTNGANLALDKLLNDMLVYGAEAQKTSGYMLYELATDGVDWAQASGYQAPTSFVANNEIVKLNDAANKVTTVGLNISNVNRIYFKVALTEGAQIKVYRNGVEVDYTVDGATVYTEAIYATDFDAVYTIEIVYDGNVVSRVNYSVNNYIISMHGHNKVGAITTALNNYGQSAVAYKATLPQ